MDQEHFPIWDRLHRSRETLYLAAGNDVVHGYYSKAQQYISRSLIACPSPDSNRCPYEAV